jgi:chromosome segregation ATPase
LEQANERTEDAKRRERELTDTLARLRQRLTEKERQCETLRREAERAIDIHSQLEAKVDRQAPVMKPAQIQTEKTEDQILLE